MNGTKMAFQRRTEELWSEWSPTRSSPRAMMMNRILVVKKKERAETKPPKRNEMNRKLVGFETKSPNTPNHVFFQIWKQKRCL
jgi:hypothetical protein